MGILFGGELVHFNSFGASINSVFLCLNGDFGWYSDLTEEVSPLAAGFPYTIFAIWFWSFMILVVMLLLNMLVAIIMDTYSNVMSELAEMPDTPYIWSQA